MKFEVLVEIRLWVRFVVLDSISHEWWKRFELKYKNWRLDECVRDETCSVVRIGIECNDCNRDSISMMFVMNRSVLEC